MWWRKRYLTAAAAYSIALFSKESGIITYIKVDQMLDPLRGNPRFEVLANKIIPPDSK